LLNEAVNSFKEAIRLKSDYADAYYGLGQAYFDLGRWSEAIEALDNAIKIDPKVEGAYMKLGESYSRLRAESRSVDERKSATRSNSGPVETTSTGSDNTGSRPVPNSSESTMIYFVGVGDVLDIRISGSPSDKSTLFTVTSHGRLEHPLLPRPLNVLGLTTDAIRTKIEGELKGKAINEKPDVLVAVREYVSHTIIVSGLVRNPGTKILRREALPLYVVLAEAQPVAEAERASVISKGSAEITTVELADPKAMSLAVRSGDVVSVQVRPKQYFYIGGEVKAPGEKSFRPGLTLTQAILAAGGLSGKANTVQVARESTNGRLAVTRYKLDDINTGKLPDPLIQHGDRITAQ
jgi:protein involved in polysaccharide export with SLBB domain